MDLQPTVGVPPSLRSEAAWEAVEHSRDFTELVGYAPALMERKVIGNINLAYIFALSQFAMTWIVMALYVRSARRFDAQSATVLATLAREDRA